MRRTRDYRWRPQHEKTDGDHKHAEQRKEIGTIERFAEHRAEQRACYASRGEHDGARPFHCAEPRVCGKTEGCVEGDGDSGRADGEMWRRHADKIDEERHGKDRTAATDQAEGQPPTKAPDAMAREAASRLMVIAARSTASSVDAGSTAWPRAAWPCRTSR